MEGKENSSRNLHDGFSNIGEITDESRTHLSYLGLPVYYRFALGKLGIKGGVQPLIYLFGSDHYHSFGEINGEPFSNNSNTKGIKLSRIDIGPKIGFDFSIKKNIRLRADYYLGLTDISDDIFSTKNNLQQISLGAIFIFEKSEELKK